MVAIGFSVFRKEILNGTKRQTIRLNSKKWLDVYNRILKNKKNDIIMLQLYWHLRQKDCELLREEKLLSLFAKYLSEMTEADAIKDGFGCLSDLKVWFKSKYPKIDFEQKCLWIIQW